MGKCPSCGLESDSGKFCGKCGGRLPKTGGKSSSKSGHGKRAPDDNEKPSTDEWSPDDVNESEGSGGKKSDALDLGSSRPGMNSPKREASSPQVTDASEIDRLSAALKKNPSSVESYIRLAEALLLAGKADRAFSTFRAGKAMAPDDVRIHNLGGKILETMGRPDDAIEAYQKVLEIDPGNVEVTLEITRLLFETGRRQRALELLQKLKSKADRHPEILLKTAEIRLCLKDFSAAQEDLSVFRKIAGEPREMFILMGRAMLGQSFFDGAIGLFREGLARFPDDPDLLLGLGKAFIGSGEKRQAVLEFERAIQQAPERVEVLLEMGRLYGAMGLDDKAEEIFDRIRKQDVRDGEIFFEIGRYYRSKNLNDQALEEIERAKKCSPHNPDVISALAEVFESRRDFAKALGEYETFLEGMPNAQWALGGVIRTAALVGDYRKVARAQKAVIQSGNQTPDAWCDLGETLIRLGQFEEANKSFEKAAQLDPTNVRAYQAPELIKIEKARSQGEKLVKEAREAMNKKFWLTAVDKVERALELVPRETPWIRLLAELNLRIGAITRAAERLSKVRAADPHDFWVAYQLARVYEFEEKNQLAIELLSSTMKDHPYEMDGHLMLYRLKRSQVQAARFEREMLSSIIRNIQSDFAKGQKGSHVPQLVEAMAYYIFGMGSQFQLESLKRAEEIFEEVIYRNPDQVYAHRGLCLIFRSRGDYKKALYHMQEMVKLSSDPGALFAMARLNENFQNFSEAKRCYASLKNLFPENGMYRRRIFEAAARDIEHPGAKNEIFEILTSVQELLRADPNNPWLHYDLAWIQTIIARRASQRDEWAKKAIHSWNKAASQNDVSPWTKWGLMEIQSEFLKGSERQKAMNQNLRICERLVREFPDMASSHAFLGMCYLGFDDLTQTERALKHLETAVFIDPAAGDLNLLLARVYRTLGKTSRVDVIRQNMILLEPELALKI